MGFAPVVWTIVWQKAWRDVRRRPLRSLFTVAGVIIGVAGLVAIVTVGRGFVRVQQTTFEATRQPHVEMWVWNASPSLARAVSRRPGVEAADVRFDHYAQGRVAGQPTTVHLVGLWNFEAQRVGTVELLAGRWPRRADEAAAEPAADLRLGEVVSFRDSFGFEHRLTIVGLARRPTALSATLTGVPTLYVPAETLQRALNVAGGNQLLVRVLPTADRQQVAEDVARLLDRRGVQHGRPRVYSPDDFPGKRELDALLVVLALFSALGVAVSGFLVANTLNAIVVESAADIGILKAVGATRAQVLATYLATALVYGGVGSVLGLSGGALLGFGVMRGLGRLLNLAPPFMVEPLALGAGLFVGMIVSALGGLLPAWQAANTPVRTVLAAYGISADFGRGALDRLASRWLRLPPLAAMAVRNVLRRKGRSLMTGGALALAVAGFLGAVSTEASVNRTIETVFSIYAADAWMITGYPSGVTLSRSLEAVPGVVHAEAWLLRDCWVGRAPARCWGLPPDTRLYRPVLVEGAWLDPADPLGVVVSQDVAVARGLQPGASVRLRIGDRWADVRVRGVVHDNSVFLGSAVTAKVFLPLSLAARLTGDRLAANIYALETASSDRKFVESVLAAIQRRFADLQPAGEPAVVELEAARRQSGILALALRGMVVLVTAIGALGVTNTFALNVAERRREIGVLRAVGVTTREFLELYGAEGAVFAAAGWTTGSLLGWLVGRLFVGALERVLFTIPLVFTPALLLWGGVFAVILTVLASIGPALVAASVPPASVLRYE